MGLFNFLMGKAEDTVQRMAQDNAFHYVREVSGFDMRSLPTSLIDDSHTRMVAIYHEMARRSGIKPFNVPEEAALRVAFIAVRAAVTKTADPGELTVVLGRVLAEGGNNIGPMCLEIINRALENGTSYLDHEAKKQSTAHQNTAPNNAGVREAKKTAYVTAAQSHQAREKLLKGKW